jgi:hypothetical protein
LGVLLLAAEMPTDFVVLPVLQILLIRSLYSYVRVLPAYRMYHASKRHGSDLFHTRYMLSTAPKQQQQQQQQHAAAAGSGAGRMCHFTFSPVETATGQFGITVEYQPATTVHFLEVRIAWREKCLNSSSNSSGLVMVAAGLSTFACAFTLIARTMRTEGTCMCSHHIAALHATLQCCSGCPSWPLAAHAGWCLLQLQQLLLLLLLL